MDILYERIRELRKNKGMTQQELASRCGYNSRAAINRIEAGLVNIPASKVPLFAKALDTTIEYLMGWETPVTNIIEEFSDKHELLDLVNTLSPNQIKKVITFIGMIK